MTDLASRGVRFVRVLHADIHGNARSKELPLSRLPASLGYCMASLAEGLDGEPFVEGPGFIGGPEFPDAFAVPELASARVVPWEPESAWVLADLTETGLCSRSALRRVLARFGERGLEAICASELEFYLLDGDERYSPRVGMAYTSGRRSDPDGVVRGILEALDGLGVPATTALREFSPGQFEVNLHHEPALAAADSAFLLKEVAREVASAHELVASFMPKPFADDEGSSHHIHLSLWRGGGNAFATDDGLVRQFAAGVIEHAPALCAVGSPIVNSYKRLGAGGLSPTHANLSGDDRGAFLRIPGEGGPHARVEVRGADASSNPYLLYAATLAAGLDGIERELAVPDSFPVLPATLDVALDALAGDAVVAGALGPDLTAARLAIGRRDLQRFSRAVTDWERAEYLTQA